MKNRVSGKSKNALLALLACMGIGFAMGIPVAVNSPRLKLSVIEVNEDETTTPSSVAAEAGVNEIYRRVTRLVAHSNLFDIDLTEVEKAISQYPWVKSVEITKIFPQTLEVSVSYRQPKAIFQNSDGSLALADEEGYVFSPEKARADSTLPILSGFPEDGTESSRHLVREGLAREQSAEKLLKEIQAEISAVYWDVEHGLRALVIYPLGEKSAEKARTYLDLTEDSLPKSVKVLRFLSRHRIQARQIWADGEKKIVVKIASGS